MGGVLPDQPDPVHPWHVHGHGEHDPDLYADFSAHSHAIRDGPGPIRNGDADQLCTRTEHASGWHNPVYRLRDWRRHCGRGDALNLAILQRADRAAAPRHVRPGLLALASSPADEVRKRLIAVRVC